MSYKYRKTWEGILGQLERRYRDTSSESRRHELEKLMATVPARAARGAAAAGEPGRSRSAEEHRRAHELWPSARRCTLLLRSRLKLERARTSHRAPILKRSASAWASSSQRGPELPDARPRGHDAVRGREPAHPAGNPDRLATHRRAVHPRRAVDRPAPAGQPRLLDTLGAMRDLGNTVIVVEHDEETIRRADYVVDLGPGAGELGGEIVVAGTPQQIARCKASLTGAYLTGRERIEVPVEQARRTARR